MSNFGESGVGDNDWAVYCVFNCLVLFLEQQIVFYGGNMDILEMGGVKSDNHFVVLVDDILTGF